MSVVLGEAVGGRRRNIAARLREAVLWLAVPRHLILAGGLLLAVLYTVTYLDNPALPGNIPSYPQGWWGWFDQSRTLESARALSHRDFAPDRHWYPLGYAILGALLGRPRGLHGFFGVDLMSLLTAYAGFVAFARREGVPAPWAVPLFLLTACGDHRFLAQWQIPWNTTPVAALLWLLLATAAAHGAGRRRPFALGLLTALVPLFRPTDLLIAAPCLLAALAADLRGRRLRGVDIAALALGAALPVLPYLALHWRIYGPHPTGYMLMSRQIGFTLYDFGWKAYVVLVDPRAWFLDGEGLLHRAPWMAFGIAGLVPALLRGRAAGLLAVVLAVHALLYLSYVDLLPTGIWRFHNVHYWTFAFPGYGLLGLLLVRDLIRPATPGRRWVAGLSLAATAVLLCLHLSPVPAAAGEPAKMLRFSGAPPGFDAVYGSGWVAADDAGTLRSPEQVRAIPVPDGLRVFAFRRAIREGWRWIEPPAGWTNAAPPSRWRIGISLGQPCWIKLVRCPRQPEDDLLPPSPD
jgi:hypothetical protein